MHIRNDDPPYLSTSDAMSYWVEVETAVGVTLTGDSQMKIIAPFGVSNLLQGTVTLNEKRKKSIDFHHRVESKGWMTHWPRLKIVAQC